MLADANEPASDRLRFNEGCAKILDMMSGSKYSSGQDPDRRQCSMACSVHDGIVSKRQTFFVADSTGLVVDGLSGSRGRFRTSGCSRLDCQLVLALCATLLSGVFTGRPEYMFLPFAFTRRMRRNGSVRVNARHGSTAVGRDTFLFGLVGSLSRCWC